MTANNMKYFGINWTDDIDQIGFYPQTTIHTGIDVVKNEMNHHETFLQRGFVDVNFKAKPTNFLANAPLSKGIIVDRKFIGVLEKHNLPPHRVHPIRTNYRNGQLEYFWFVFTSNTQRYIDFNQSKVEIVSTASHRAIGEFELTSIEFNNKIYSALTFEHALVIKAIYLKSTFPNYDIIDLDKIRPGIFISEKLNDALKSEGLTGFKTGEYKPIKLLTE